MSALGLLELIFSTAQLPALEQTVFRPCDELPLVTTSFVNAHTGLRWGNAAISLTWCLIDYRVWAETHRSGDYEFPAQSQPRMFDTLCNLLDTPREFALIFEPGEGALRSSHRRTPLLKHIFLPPFRGPNRHARINRELLPPENIVIKCGDTIVPANKLAAFREAVRRQYRVTGRGKADRRLMGVAAGKQDLSISNLGEFTLRTPILNDTFISGPLDAVQCWLELGLAEKQATDAQWQRVSERAAAWLRQHPEDLLVRATALWLALVRGNFSQMAEAVKQTAHWILAEESFTTAGDGRVIPPVCRYELDQMLCWLEPNGPLSKWHLEDHLVRAVLLRWLRVQGKASPSGKMAAEIKRVLEMKGGPRVAVIVAPLLDEPHVARALAKAGELTLRHLPNYPQSNLLRAACLWIIGRRGLPGQVSDVIEGMSLWLKAHPEEMLVRAVWMWLTGLHGGREQAERVIEDVGGWLEQAPQRDECLARSSWLWLVGHRGTETQTDEAIARTAVWLQGHPNDDFICLVNLLFLVKRRGSREQIAAAIQQNRNCLASHPDDHLAQLALDYTERAVAS